MKFNTRTGGWIWIDVSQVKSLTFTPQSIFKTDNAKHTIVFEDQSTLDTYLAQDEEVRFLAQLDQIEALKLESFGIYSPPTAKGNIDA